MGKKRTALIQVECMYEVPIPEDLNLTDEEAGKWALQEFIRNSTVNVVTSSVGDKPSFREEHIETKDGRARDFDSVVVHSVTEDREIERILEAICNGGKVEKTSVEKTEKDND